MGLASGLGIVGVAPTITTGPTNLTQDPGQTARFTVVAGGTAALNYQWQAGAAGSGSFTNLTEGSKFSGSTTAALTISNMTLADTADYRVVITNFFGSTSSVARLTLTINCFLNTLTPSSLPDGTVNVPYAQSLTATGGISPYVFAIWGGTPPPGLTLSRTGLLSGTPTVAGTFAFTIGALDANGCLGTNSYAVTMGCPGIIIGPGSLASGAWVLATAGAHGGRRDGVLRLCCYSRHSAGGLEPVA